jgi:intraflagellar transport protein 52
MTGEGGETSFNTNFNYFLEEYGISVNPDSVARTVYFKYFHPKEVYVTQGIVNREINRAAGKKQGSQHDSNDSGLYNPNSLTFVYPFGASMNVQKPAIPLLSSGTVSYPLNRPIAGVYQGTGKSGKVLATGSAQMFSDQYIDKEENGKIFDIFVQYLTKDKIVMNPIDANEPDVYFFHVDF